MYIFFILIPNVLLQGVYPKEIMKQGEELMFWGINIIDNIINNYNLKIRNN